MKRIKEVLPIFLLVFFGDIFFFFLDRILTTLNTVLFFVYPSNRESNKTEEMSKFFKTFFLFLEKIGPRCAPATRR